MRRTVYIVMALSLTLIASTSFASQKRDHDPHKRPQVVQTQKHSHARHYDRHARPQVVKVSRQGRTSYVKYRQPVGHRYQAKSRDHRTTIVIPAPPIHRIVLRFPW